MLRHTRCLIALGCLVALTASASAQETKPVGLSLRAGIFTPNDSTARGAGSTWFALGGELKLKDLHFGERDAGYSSQLSLSVDYYSKGGYRHTPIMVNYVGRNNQIYYSAGAGFGLTEVPVVGSKTLLAYGLGVGYDFQQAKLPVFVEARYFGSTDSKLNGFGFFVGVRL